MLINDYDVIFDDDFDFDEEEDFNIDDEILLDDEKWIREMENPLQSEEEFSKFITGIPVPEIIVAAANLWKKNILDPEEEFQIEDSIFRIEPLEMDILIIRKKVRDGSWVDAAIASDGEGGYRWVV